MRIAPRIASNLVAAAGAHKAFLVADEVIPHVDGGPLIRVFTDVQAGCFFITAGWPRSGVESPPTQVPGNHATTQQGVKGCEARGARGVPT